MLTQLIINLAGSSFEANFDNLQAWRVILDNADSIALARDGAERVRVQLSGQRRWIAFNRITNGCPLFCVGWQETVGAIERGGLFVGGSNRKTLAWLHPSGRVELE